MSIVASPGASPWRRDRHQLAAGAAAAAAGGTSSCGGDAEDVMARFSVDVSAGCGGRNSTLLDEYERLAFEAQLNRAILLRRCYSEPSPSRFAQEPRAAAAADAHAPPAPGQGEAARRHGAAGGRFWRLHEVVARWLQALRPVLRWLRGAWERRRGKEPSDPDADAAAARRPPPTVPPRVQLLDYLR